MVPSASVNLPSRPSPCSSHRSWSKGSSPSPPPAKKDPPSPKPWGSQTPPSLPWKPQSFPTQDPGSLCPATPRQCAGEQAFSTKLAESGTSPPRPWRPAVAIVRGPQDHRPGWGDWRCHQCKLMERRGFKSTEGSASCLLSQCPVSAPTPVWSGQPLSQEAHPGPCLAFPPWRAAMPTPAAQTHKKFPRLQPPRSRPAGHFLPGLDLANVSAGE